METIVELVRGDMTPALRVWSALAPVLLVTAWFVVGLVVFAIKSAMLMSSLGAGCADD